MKKSLLFLMLMTLFVSTNKAESFSESNYGFNQNYRNDAVTFIENGIRFHVFLNGDFDFDTRIRNRRSNWRPKIYRDFNGRISRVGNVFIRYDYRGNVRKIGTIYMNYRSGRLARVGNLRIYYNRWGDIEFRGEVRYNAYYNPYLDYNYNFNPNIGVVCAYNDPYFYQREFRNNYSFYGQDDNFFYYRANTNANVSRNKVLKRRKTKSTNRRRTTTNSRNRRS